MTVDEFLAWTVGRPDRDELIDGEPIAMAPEGARHNVVKGRIFRSLGDAVQAAGLSCAVFTDGMTMRIDEHVTREPDAAVQCGVAQDLDATVLAAPMIVVEVTSPSSGGVDSGTKLADYFQVPSIEHYLILDTARARVIHHRRDRDAVRSIVVAGPALRLDPPGLDLSLDGPWP
jgi:Uma2 family endonuclease